MNSTKGFQQGIRLGIICALAVLLISYCTHLAQSQSGEKIVIQALTSEETNKMRTLHKEAEEANQRSNNYQLEIFNKYSESKNHPKDKETPVSIIFDEDFLHAIIVYKPVAAIVPMTTTQNTSKEK